MSKGAVQSGDPPRAINERISPHEPSTSEVECNQRLSLADLPRCISTVLQTNQHAGQLPQQACGGGNAGTSGGASFGGSCAGVSSTEGAQVSRCALGVDSCLEDETRVVLQNFQPVCDV